MSTDTDQTTFDPFAAPAARPDGQAVRPTSNGTTSNGTTPAPTVRPDGQTRPASNGSASNGPASSGPAARPQTETPAAPASKTTAERPKPEILAAQSAAVDAAQAAVESAAFITDAPTERVLVVVRGGKVLVTTDPRVLLVDLDKIDASKGTDEIVETLKGLKDTAENGGRSQITDELMNTFRVRLGL